MAEQYDYGEKRPKKQPRPPIVPPYQYAPPSPMRQGIYSDYYSNPPGRIINPAFNEYPKSTSKLETFYPPPPVTGGKSGGGGGKGGSGGSGGGGGGAGGGGGGGLPGLSGFPKPPSGKYTKADLERAQQLIDLEFGPQFSALDREKKLGQFDYDRLVKELQEQQALGLGTQQKFGDIADERLQTIYNSLQGELESGLGRTRDIYARGGEQIGNIYSKALSDIGATGGGVNQALQTSAEALGQQQALGDPMARLAAELQGIKGRTAEAGAASQANLATLGTQMEGIGAAGISQSRQEVAGRRADLVGQINNAMGQIQVEFAKGRRDLSANLQRQLMDIADRYTDLSGQKGLALKETLRQVEEARTDREKQYWMDQFNSQMQLAQLDLQKSQLALQRSQASAGRTVNPLDQRLKELQIKDYERQLNAPPGGLKAGEKAITDPKVNEAYWYIATNSKDLSSAIGGVGAEVKARKLNSQQATELRNAILIAAGEI